MIHFFYGINDLRSEILSSKVSSSYCARYLWDYYGEVTI